MPSRLLRVSAVILLMSLVCPGCAYMSKSGRQQMAYQHYIRKHVRQREKALAQAQKKAKHQMKKDLQSLPPDDPQVTATADRMEPMAPITVSESASPESVTGAPQP